MIVLPPAIEESSFLSPQQKRMLANVGSLPFIDPSFHDERLQNIFQYFSLNPEEMDAEVHTYAAILLEEQKVKEAWQVLLTNTAI